MRRRTSSCLETGLTALDVVATLKSRGHRGSIHLMSRSGFSLALKPQVILRRMVSSTRAMRLPSDCYDQFAH